jgi:hypothetical protein
MIVRRHRLLPGRVLVGFGMLFERSYGNPGTPTQADGSYPKVTPTRLGALLLPFPCPHCEAVRPVVVHPRKRQGYQDAERGFSWCPACSGRYVLDAEGTPLASPLPAGATHAPALVERDGKATVVGGPKADGLDDLGAC